MSRYTPLPTDQGHITRRSRADSTAPPSATTSTGQRQSESSDLEVNDQEFRRPQHTTASWGTLGTRSGIPCQHEVDHEGLPMVARSLSPNSSEALQLRGHTTRHQLMEKATTSMPPVTRKTVKKHTSAYRLWLWELVAIIFSLACIGSIVAILINQHKQPLQQWQHGLGKYIQPNALVSLLGTLGKSSCLLALAEILSQLKWIHFTSGAHRLSELQLFDEASRGPLGSLRLFVLKNRTTALASCASLLVMAALLMDPFVQLIFDFPSELVNVTDRWPSIQTSHTYEPWRTESWSGLNCLSPGTMFRRRDVDPMMQASILTAMWNITLPPALPCDFESCKWPTITTLGACSSCRNLSESVTSECKVRERYPPPFTLWCNHTMQTINETFATEFSFYPATGNADSFFEYTLWNSSASRPVNVYPGTSGFPSLLLSVNYVAFDDDMAIDDILVINGPSNITMVSRPTVREAMQCDISLCARTFDNPYFANFSGGPLSGETTLLNVEEVNDQKYVRLRPVAASEHSPMNSEFLTTKCHWDNLAEFLSELFTATYSTGGRSIDRRAVEDMGRILASTSDVPALVQSVADSMTETIRTSVNSTSVNGIGQETLTYIVIRWQWLALPISIVLLTSAMLFVVIFQSRASDAPTWKSSSLPLLFYKLNGWNDTGLVKGDNVASVRERAVKMKASVEERGGYLVFARPEQGETG